MLQARSAAAEGGNVKPSLRRAIPADLPAMMALEKTATTAAHWSAKQYKALFHASGLTRIVLIVQEETQLQGFIVASEVGTDWEIENLVIRGPGRRRGLGTLLLGGFLEVAKAKGAGSVFLEVRRSNRAARSLYEKWSFTESGHRKSYYENPVEDAIVYRLSLH